MPLPGTIAPTDYGWYQFLSQRRHWDEVNFWTPSSHWTFRAPEFSPFLFKLKSPHNAIAGFGFFARYSPLPEWLAWECFGEGNGCGSFVEMRDRIGRIRQRLGPSAARKRNEIGCIVLVTATFFEPDDWIAQPADWPKQNLRPMRYDLDVREGARVWQACLERMAFREAETAGRGLVAGEERARYGEPTLIQPRLGQGAFRVAVTQAYARACAATGEHSLPALEAAHIKPFALDGPHEVSNGLLLRADLHRLFDKGYVTVTPDLHFEVSRRLRDDFENGRSYYPLHGKELVSLPLVEAERPSLDLLRWHNEQVFRG